MGRRGSRPYQVHCPNARFSNVETLHEPLASGYEYPFSAEVVAGGDRCSPHPPPLPKERETVWPGFEESEARGCCGRKFCCSDNGRQPGCGGGHESIGVFEGKPAGEGEHSLDGFAG